MVARMYAGPDARPDRVKMVAAYQCHAGDADAVSSVRSDGNGVAFVERPRLLKGRAPDGCPFCGLTPHREEIRGR